MTKDGSRAERILETLEGFVGIEAPGQGLGLAMQHGGERRCEPMEWMDETPIEVRKS